MPPAPQAVGDLRRIALAHAAALAQGSRIVDAGPFRLFIWPRVEPFYRTLAVPVATTAEWPSAVRRLIAAFDCAGRRPRIEFAPELWPGLQEALEEAGFTVHHQGTVMSACRLARAAEPHRRWQLEQLTADQDTAHHRALLCALAEAFEEPSPGDLDAEAASLADRLRKGSLRCVVAREGHLLIGGASLMMGDPAVAELGGVWVRRDRRGAGLATMLCRDLLAAFFADGGQLAWLWTVAPAGRVLYGRLGFRPIGTQVDMAVPAAA